jgi:hypothetical protein
VIEVGGWRGAYDHPLSRCPSIFVNCCMRVPSHFSRSNRLLAGKNKVTRVHAKVAGLLLCALEFGHSVRDQHQIKCDCLPVTCLAAGYTVPTERQFGINVPQQLPQVAPCSVSRSAM